jgi:hypothetical protein
VGRTFRDPLLGMLMSHLALMIIGQLDVIRIAVYKSKANPPLIVYGDGMLPFPIAPQFM